MSIEAQQIRSAQGPEKKLQNIPDVRTARNAAILASVLAVAGCSTTDVARVDIPGGSLTFAAQTTGGNPLKPTGIQQATVVSEHAPGDEAHGSSEVLKANQHAFAPQVGAMVAAVGYAVGNYGLKSQSKSYHGGVNVEGTGGNADAKAKADADTDTRIDIGDCKNIKDGSACNSTPTTKH